EGRARSLIAQINDNPLESNAVLVQGDERLVAEGRERMEIELQRQADGPALVPSSNNSALLPETGAAIRAPPLPPPSLSSPGPSRNSRRASCPGSRTSRSPGRRNCSGRT